jgi:hypothetical protein
MSRSSFPPPPRGDGMALAQRYVPRALRARARDRVGRWCTTPNTSGYCSSGTSSSPTRADLGDVLSYGTRIFRRQRRTRLALSWDAPAGSAAPGASSRPGPAAGSLPGRARTTSRRPANATRPCLAGVVRDEREPQRVGARPAEQMIATSIACCSQSSISWRRSAARCSPVTRRGRCSSGRIRAHAPRQGAPRAGVPQRFCIIYATPTSRFRSHAATAVPTAVSPDRVPGGTARLLSSVLLRLRRRRSGAHQQLPTGRGTAPRTSQRSSLPRCSC